jgi:FkbM family methyltransferase
MSYVFQWLRWFGTRDFLPMRLRMALLGRVVKSQRLPTESFTVPLADSGFLYRGVLNDWMDWNVFFLGGYKRSTIDLIRRAARAADRNGRAVFADVGASVGQMAMSTSPLVARVLAFEPSPPIAAICREHVRLNGLDNITVVQAALSNADGQATFFIGANSKGTGSLRGDFNADPDNAVIVPIRRGDSFMAEFGVDQLDLLKIDAQGREVSVAEGFSDVIKRDQPIIIVCLPRIVHGNADDMARFRTVLGPAYDLFRIRNQFGRTAGLIDFNLNPDAGSAVVYILAVPKARREAVERHLPLPR